MTAVRMTAAGRLLDRVATEGILDLAEIARRLGTRPALLEDCRAGRERLPPGTQLELAELILAVSPAHARLARALRGQAEAAARFEAQEVRTHMTRPVTWKR